MSNSIIEAQEEQEYALLTLFTKIEIYKMAIDKGRIDQSGLVLHLQNGYINMQEFLDLMNHVK